ncbi:hypothetical protein LP417_33895 (plasmid) [Polaromonas sp. P1-6]|nr:hypothetical protein LP417_33895 [Polaromonas sp. P1-6]
MFFKFFKQKKAVAESEGLTGAATVFAPRKSPGSVARAEPVVLVDQLEDPEIEGPTGEANPGKTVSVRTIDEFSSLPLPFESLIDDLQLGEHLSFNVRPVIFGGPKGSGAGAGMLAGQ